MPATSTPTRLRHPCQSASKHGGLAKPVSTNSPISLAKQHHIIMAATVEFTATGRRKTAVATVRLCAGSGQITVNGKDFEDYFPTEATQNRILEPLSVINKIKEFDISVKAKGGGLNGQAGAVSLGIARALLDFDPQLKDTMREHGLLTRDPRMKERKKSGQPGARKRFQFSKR